MSKKEPKTIRVYTTADAFSDLVGTVTLNARAGVTSTGHDVRLVEIPEEIYREQMKSYITGLYTVLDEQEWKFEQQFGNIKAIDDTASQSKTKVNRPFGL